VICEVKLKLLDTNQLQK